MDNNEKAQRLMLVTNVKFSLDNKTGEIVESDEPIDQAVIDEAMNMPKAEYESRLENQRRDNIVAQLISEYSMQAAFLAYQQAGGLLDFNAFARSAVDVVKDAKIV